LLRHELFGFGCEELANKRVPSFSLAPALKRLQKFPGPLLDARIYFDMEHMRENLRSNAHTRRPALADSPTQGNV
jgi:hypothetical protein